MMLRTNLSTRPFYNERLVNLLLVLAAAGGIALAAYSGTRLVDLWGQRSALAQKRAASEAEAAHIKAAAEREQGRVDRGTMLLLAAATVEANSLIDERTFSWTVFFGLVEKTLPLDARLIAVAPRDEKGVFRINMIVNAKRAEDLSAFLDALRTTGSFYDLLPEGQQLNDDGTYNATLTGSYEAPHAPKPVKAKTSGAPDGPGGRP